ncbi:MAG: RIP metalloprotease RseP [Azoarcus sp.]|jgi:regulator of sigma E protease|nr:RIP metalloprotease RseP [Azoarcus sp.]
MSFLFDYVIPFLVALGLLIFVHELGHYWVARWCGVKVLRFSIGFGRPLFKWRMGADGTEWVLAVFPLGGYVKMLDENEGEVAAHELSRAFNRQPIRRRFAIVAAGPVFNLLLAAVLYWGLFVAGSSELRPFIVPTAAADSVARTAGVREGDLVLEVNGDEVKSWQDLRWALLRRAIDRSEARLLVRTAEGGDAVRTLDLGGFSIDDAGREDPVILMGLRPLPFPALIDGVEEGGAAAKAGLRKGDEIAAIDGKPVASSREVVEIVRASSGQSRIFTVRRAGEERDFTVTPDEKRHGDGDAPIGFIGASFDASAMFATVRYGPFDALVRAIRLTWETSVLSLKSIGQMIVGNISLKNVSGPLTIADFAGKSAQLGPAPFIRFLALISISLGVLNLLPVPVLDGGHLLYYALEFIKGGALSGRVVEVSQRIGLTLLLMLMAFALFNDINRLVS